MDSKLTEVLSRARRRCLTNLVLDQSALALTIGMSGAILLLLIGTHILDWYWVVLIALVSLGVGVYRLRKTVPTTYQLAQRIDRRLVLADALSTAIYFSDHDATGKETIRDRQREESEHIAQTVDVKQAVPFTKSRFVWPALALTAVACGMFAVRFAVTGSLNLEPSLVKIAFDTFFPEKKEMAQVTKKKRDPLKTPDQGDSSDGQTVQNDPVPEQPLEANQTPESATPQADSSKEGAKQGKQDDKANDVQGDNADKGDKSDKQPSDTDAKDNPADKSPKDGKQQDAKDGKQGSQSENSSLMDKLKDAMANMMNKMKSSPKDGQQPPQNEKGQKGEQDKNSQQSKQGQPQNEKSNAEAQSDQQQSDAGDKKQSADAKGAEKSSDKNASQDSKSGIGSADGDKSAKEAEQQAAMGKISEILGKRAQNVTGEVMVEVGSSKQQLKTPWAQKQAVHVEAGGEINRDEVPLMYQQYVQQYFEEIRKGTETPKPANPPVIPPAKN